MAQFRQPAHVSSMDELRFIAKTDGRKWTIYDRGEGDALFEPPSRYKAVGIVYGGAKPENLLYQLNVLGFIEA